MKRLYTIICLLFLTGCSVVSYDRVFPKLTWYWAWDAKVQRAERAQQKEWARTNTLNHKFDVSK